jgi:hypothetical protein
MKKFLSLYLIIVSLLVVSLAVGGMNDRFSPIELTDIPNATSGSDIVTKTATQTLTNKTLTSPTITNPTVSGTATTSAFVAATATVSQTITAKYGVVSNALTAGTLTATNLNGTTSSLGAASATSLSATSISGTTISGTTITATSLTAAIARSLTLPLPSFIITNNNVGGNSSTTNTNAAFLSTITAPAATVYNSRPVIQWTGNQASPITVTFMLPADYATGGTITLLCTQTALNQLAGFDFMVQKPGSPTPVTSATFQTVVNVSSSNTTSYSTVLLAPINAFISAVAGDWVTARIWRDTGTTAVGFGSLNVHGVTFNYTANR